MATVESKSENAPTPEATGANMAPPTPSKPLTTNMGNTPNAQAIVSDINIKFSSWRGLKRPLEAQWFLNAARLKGLQNVRWNDSLSTLEMERIPTYKVVPSINIVLPKTRQRKAKFLKNRYTPIVVPATNDKEDTLNARASKLALEYVSRKRDLERVYRDALDWALTTGKGFIWLFWDDTALGNVPIPPEIMAELQASGQPLPQEIANGVLQAPIGDVLYEAGSPFEVLVPDLSVKTIGGQHEIMRVRARPLEELKLRYKDVPGINELKGDATGADLFQYQKQIATLSARAANGAVGAEGDKADRDLNMVIVKEWFARPCGKYPKGAYAVVAGPLLLKYQDTLPYGFAGLDNPYPVIEFADIELAGQFWPTCTVEQLSGIQTEYNDYRRKLKNHLAKSIHPKIIVSAYCKMPANAWRDEAGEKIEILTPPGVPAPQVITPPQISGDLWRAIDLLRTEADIVANLPSVAPTGTGQQPTSGFQFNVQQEVVDSVHAPDIRQHEHAFEELYYKTRRIMAQGYTIPRLIAISGKSHAPDEAEFSKSNIDENAEIIVYSGTALSNSPAIRTQQVIELWQSGILQDPSNPQEAQRKALAMLDAQGIGEFQEKSREHEDKARLENIGIQNGEMVIPPIPFDNHLVHYESHVSQAVSAEFSAWDDDRKKELYAHIILHMKYINPQQALNTALELGLPELVLMLQPPPMPGQPATPGGPEAQAQSAPAAQEQK